jgi:glycerol kinase
MMDKPYIISIDQSTSGTKAVIFNRKAEFVARANADHTQYYPKPGWVEHDPEEIFQNTIRVVREVIEQTGISENQINHISITNQRETVMAWDKKTGIPVSNAVVWQCMRGEEKCNALKELGHEPLIRQKTGLLIDPYFSASGLSWILNNTPGIKRLIRNNRIAAGTIDSWLIWKLTGGKSHYTDFSNACRTLLFNIHTLQWDEEICWLFNIPVYILPKVKHADDIFGTTMANGLFKEEIPVSGVLGDSHGALFGQRCFREGLSKVTYGTGSSVMLNIGNRAASAPEGLVTSIGYSLRDEIAYVFEGNIHSTGATIKWMTDMLGIIPSPDKAEEIATSVESTEGVCFVPAFSGLGAPYWNNQIRATLSGISGGTTKAHIVRAGLESIAYQVKDLLDLMAEKAGISLREIRVDGGPTRNNFLMQFQSDMLNASISISDIEEASALGAALAGGLGTGMWGSLAEIEQLYKSRGHMAPQMNPIKCNKFYQEWKNAVAQILK